MASISAAAFWNPTGLVPRPPSPVQTHLFPATTLPSASFGAGTNGFGTPTAGGNQGGTSTPTTTTGPGATAGFAAIAAGLSQEESDYVHVGYPTLTATPSASIGSASEFSAVAETQSDAGTGLGVESIADSSEADHNLIPATTPTTTTATTAEPEAITTGPAAGTEPVVPSTETREHRAGSLITGTDLPNSMGYVPGFNPSASTTLSLATSNNTSTTTVAKAGGERDNEFGIILAFTSDEPLIRRLNGLEEAQTCTTSEKGSDAMWRLPAKEVLSALEKIVRGSTAAAASTTA